MHSWRLHPGWNTFKVLRLHAFACVHAGLWLSGCDSVCWSMHTAGLVCSVWAARHSENTSMAPSHSNERELRSRRTGIGIICRLWVSDVTELAKWKQNWKTLILLWHDIGWIWTGTKRRDRITPVLAYLHWLPVRLSTDSNTLLIIFKAQKGPWLLTL